MQVAEMRFLSRQAQLNDEPQQKDVEMINS
jgi:hypothetical protein